MHSPYPTVIWVRWQAVGNEAVRSKVDLGFKMLISQGQEDRVFLLYCPTGLSLVVSAATDASLSPEEDPAHSTMPALPYPQQPGSLPHATMALRNDSVFLLCG